MKEVIIILGAGVMQGPVINIAKELGFFTIVLDGSSTAPNISLADRFEQIDLKNKEEIETFARSILPIAGCLGIMTAGTDFSASVAWVAEKLGLPGIPYETALNASDKARMRECFKKASLPSPDFFTITDPSTPLNEARYQFPLVIKPVDNMGSRGCRRIDSIEDFYEAAKTAISFSRSGRAIVEKFMDGPEFSVDAIVYHGEITICGLADRHIFFPPYFIEMGHTMPTVIEEEKQKLILDTFCAGIQALGLSDKKNIGAAKGDIKLTTQGPMIGEIAARLSGGYMSGWTYPYSSGALPIKAAILAAMGREPEGLVPTKKWTCAERAFISIPGTVKQILGVREQGSGSREKETGNIVNDFFMRIKEGDKVSFPENNVTKCGNVIASAPDRESATIAAETAARSVLIRLDPADPETAKFLSKESHAEPPRHGENEVIFPPNAFKLTYDLKEALIKLPEYKENFTTNTHELEPSVRTRTTDKTSKEEFVEVRDGSWLKNKEILNIIPFPAFEASGLRDYMGRTAEEALEAVRLLTGFPLPITSENAENKIRLGRSFWAALIRGSYQGAVYYIENLEVEWKKSKVSNNY